MLKELDPVVLVRDIPDRHLDEGDVGTVVHVYGDAKTYEVVFLTAEGRTVAVLTLPADALRRPEDRDMLAAVSADIWIHRPGRADASRSPRRLAIFSGMLTLRCTAKTLKRFRIMPIDDPPVSSGRLGDWYANLLNVGRRRYVLSVSSHTLLPLILPARNSEFPHKFPEYLWAMLRELGVLPEGADEEVAEAEELVCARTSSRSVLGVMNSMADIVRHVHDRGELDENPLDISLWLGAMLHGPVEEGRPSAATRRLFGLDGGGPAGSNWLRPGDEAANAKLASTRRDLSADGRRPLPPAVRLTLELEDVEPPVRRELWIDERTSLADLHLIFQVLMGWEDRHLYQFEIAGHLFEDPVPEAEGLDARTYRLENLGIRPGDEFLYRYDFGDDWRCRVRLEERWEMRSLVGPLPEVVSGARAGPPEDVGGPEAFVEFVESLASPFHPEREASRRWAGARYDPEQFDIDATNAALARLLASGAIDPER
jgi:hypothetical protein